MIELRSISKKYGDKTVFENISLTFETGKCSALMGESGVGKTTLMRIAAGLEKPDSGDVIIDGKPKMTYVFQENRLFEKHSVLQNLLCVTHDREAALYFLEGCGLKNDIKKPAGVLSGGMKRRLAIARALAFGGDVYFFDEPLRELDDATSSMILKLIKEEISGKTAIIITHDKAHSKFLANTVFDFAGSPMKLVGTTAIPNIVSQEE